jgi:predicted nucleotidyltransferase
VCHQGDAKHPLTIWGGREGSAVGPTVPIWSAVASATAVSARKLRLAGAPRRSAQGEEPPSPLVNKAPTMTKGQPSLICGAEQQMITLLESKRQGIAALCRRYRVCRLDVFGSAVAGSFDRQTSDVDFLVEFEPLGPGERAEAYFGLLEGLQSLLGVPVDLVMARAIQNPYFRRAVEQSRELVYAS